MYTINKENASTLIEQFTLSDLTTNRASIKNVGWSDIKIDEDFYIKSINEVVELIGGRNKTKGIVKFRLKNEPCHQWFAERFIWSPSRQVWTYAAGQDYESEIIEIRKYFRKR